MVVGKTDNLRPVTHNFSYLITGNFFSTLTLWYFNTQTSYSHGFFKSEC
jgi:hypothetical protein